MRVCQFAQRIRMRAGQLVSATRVEVLASIRFAKFAVKFLEKRSRKMGRKITAFDHHIDATRLLARADVYLELLAVDYEENPRLVELVAQLRSDIADFLKRKFPS